MFTVNDITLIHRIHIRTNTKYSECEAEVALTISIALWAIRFYVLFSSDKWNVYFLILANAKMLNVLSLKFYNMSGYSSSSVIWKIWSEIRRSPLFSSCLFMYSRFSLTFAVTSRKVMPEKWGGARLCSPIQNYAVYC